MPLNLKLGGCMGNRVFSKSRRGIYISPPIWRGPQTVLSEYLLKHGVDAKAFGIKENPKPSNIRINKIIVVVTKDGG